MINIQTEIKLDSYYNLLDLSLKFCGKFLFIIRDNLHVSKSINQLLELLNKYLDEKKESDEWPGTKLFKKKAAVYIYYFNNSTVQILKEFSSSFFDWIQPDLPEDLCLLDNNNSPVLTNIAHESDVFIESSKGIEKEYTMFFDTNNIKYIINI